jgi:hypothetical protein
MLYFAYGSNLNLRQMRTRCPDATPVGGLELPNWQLVFRGVCDIVRADGESVQGGLWKITPRCEAALDRYEGYDANFPDDGMYSKEYLLVDGLPDGETTIMVYTMNSTGIYPPSSGYFAGVKQGYKDFELPVRPLIDALEKSYDDKAPSYIERQRARRNGRPSLAARPSIVAVENKRPLTRKQERKAEKRAKKKAERNAAKQVNGRHDPWAGTWGARPGRERMSLDKWLSEKYYNGERF